jgi:D-alanyl-D-alanine carboxypeptidase/D-alanyl-D-alanine-endopeptidase (penicillin-binding protein 4)
MTSVAGTPLYRHGRLAAVVAAAEHGEIVAEINGQMSMTPASVMKAITTGATLHYYSPDHRFVTTLESRGTTDATGLLHGSLVIRGGGDPTLGSGHFAGTLTSSTLLSRWVGVVRACGITGIEGEVRAEESYFPSEPPPDGWCFSDLANYYAATPAALSFHDNLYYLWFKPGNLPGDPTTLLGTTPPFGGIKWINEVLTGPAGSGDQAGIYGAPDSRFRVVRGTIPAGGVFQIKGSLPAPGNTLASLLASALSDAGISVRCRVKNDPAVEEIHSPTVIDRVESPPLGAILRVLNKESFNLYAETMLLHNAKAAGDGARAAGLRVHREFLEQLGVPMEGVHIDDGCGMDRRNSLTPAAMVTFLTLMQKQPHFKTWVESFPVLGVDGDLRARETTSPLRGRVWAKTGLITRARGLAGYIDAKTGKRYCFALFANDYTGSWVDVDRDFDWLLRVFYDAL